MNLAGAVLAELAVAELLKSLEVAVSEAAVIVTVKKRNVEITFVACRFC